MESWSPATLHDSITPLLHASLRPVPGNLRFEVAEAGPVEAAVQIDFGDGDGPPLLRLGEGAAVVAVDGGDRPVVGNLGVGAAHQVDVVLAGAGGGEERVAA